MNLIRKILEKLSFSQAFAQSEPKRVLRSNTVRMPALDVEAWKDGMTYLFNGKSYPSTTGKRWKGYLKFFSNGNRDTPLEDVPMEAFCQCPDFMYRYNWSLAQRGSAPIGRGSVSKCINRAPKITNPRNVPGLCKHLLALRKFLFGQNANFVQSDELNTDDRLKKLLGVANGVTIDSQGNRVGEQQAVEEPTEEPSEENDELEIPEVPSDELHAEERSPAPGHIPAIPPATPAPLPRQNPSNQINPRNPRNPRNR